MKTIVIGVLVHIWLLKHIVISQCEKYQVTEMSSSSNSCVSICGENEYSSFQSKHCKESNKCSLSFIQATLVNKNRQIQYVLDGGDINQIYLVYQNFVNSVDKQKGSFQRQYTFDSKVLVVTPYMNSIYLINSSGNTVTKWFPSTDVSSNIMNVTQGNLKATSAFLAVSNNKVRFAITSFDDINSIVYLTEVQTNIIHPFYSFSFISGMKFFIQKDILIKQNSNYQVSLLQIIEDPVNKILIMQQIIPNFICSGVLGMFKQIITLQKSSLENMYFIIFEKTSSIFLIDGDQCTSFLIAALPIKMFKTDIILNSGITTSLLVLSTQDGQIQFFSPPTLSLVTSISTGTSLTDFFLFQYTSIDSLYIYTLQNSSSVILYPFSIIQSDVIVLQLQTTQVIPALITNPSFLTQISLKNQNKFIDYVALTSYDIQLIKIPTLPAFQSTQLSQTTLVVKDFKDKIKQNEAKISKIAFGEIYRFIVSCSIDGKIVVWKAIDTLSPEFYYSIKMTNQQCLNVLVFKDNYIVALLTNQVLIFNAFNYLQKQSFPILNTAQFKTILATNEFIYIIKDQTIIIIDQINSILSTSQFLPNINTAFLTNNYQILIFFLDNSISLYQHNLSSHIVQTTPTYTFFNQFTISFSKIFNRSTGSNHITL